MKIQLDFDNKTITLEADCELKEFIPVIQRILPDWQKWTLRMEIITTWINPVPWPIYPYVPITTPGTAKPIWDDHTTICNSGIVNIEIDHWKEQTSN